jgi:hypothetical protein
MNLATLFLLQASTLPGRVWFLRDAQPSTRSARSVVALLPALDDTHAILDARVGLERSIEPANSLAGSTTQI